MSRRPAFSFGRRLLRSAVVAGLLLGSTTLVPSAASALQIDVLYVDQPGEGFLDLTLGVQRRAALEAAVDQWARALAGTVPIVVAADMPGLGGTGVNALLASAGAVTLHRNFSGARRDTWYPASLANQLSGVDVNGPDIPEIQITFNADVDGSEVLGSIAWYYGLDANPGVDIDFVTIALHELGHGLGFLDSIDATTGGWRLGDNPSILERMLIRPEIGPLADMQPAERLAAIVAPGDLLWDGSAVVSFNGSPLPVYSPEPFQQGSSIAHWDASLSPSELIRPFYDGANHDFGALLPALADIGWNLASDTPTPRAEPATETPTRRPRPSATPSVPRTRRDMVYVTNFDDATVSVIDAAERKVVRTVAVDDGPIGIAASADGTRIYVAAFRAGTLSLLRTADDRVVASVLVGESPNSVAVTSDGAFVAVTDTAADRVAIVAADTLEVVARVTAGRQPSGLALDGAGRLAFVSNFSGASVTVVDLDARRRRAIMPLPFTTASDGLLAIAIAPENGRGYVASYYSSWMRPLFAEAFYAGPFASPFSNGAQPEAAVTDEAGDLAYFVGHDPDTGRGRVSMVRMQDGEILREVVVGSASEALGLAPDEALLYVANTGSNNVSVIDTVSRRVIGSIPVGRAPMGVVVAAVPDGQCVEGCETPTPTPTLMPVPCDGDCDGDGTVEVSDLIKAVTIALAQDRLADCPSADGDRDQVLTISELVRAVDRSVNGCDLS